MPLSTSESPDDDLEMDMDDNDIFDVLGCKNTGHHHHHENHHCQSGRRMSLHLHRRNLAISQPLMVKQAQSSRTSSSRTQSSRPQSSRVYSNRVRMKWHRFARKARAQEDPWLKFHIEEIETEVALRHRYNAVRKNWSTDEVKVKMEQKPFNHGAMRECFRMKKLSTFLRSNDWHNASNYVAKRYMENVDENVYRSDVVLQMDAKLWGEHYNRSHPPKKVDIMQMCMLEFINREGKPLYHLEHYIEGEYIKYNSNSGFVEEHLRNTPQAFSHFTFERSGHKIIVVDIQGVGDLYTDPQIHTAEGTEYGDGNLGARGMALFFHSHVCNAICRSLHLTEFDMAPSEKEDRERISFSASSSEASTMVKQDLGISPKDGAFNFEELRSRLDSGVPEDEEEPSPPSTTSPISPPDGPLSRRRRLDTSNSESELSPLSLKLTHEEIEMWHLQQSKFHRPSRLHVCYNDELEAHKNVLGQIHHEMTRYHEAGRFLIDREHDSIDWEAAIFHEKMASDYGFLEALQTMAHYYLGLQHDVLAECPIKADASDVCKGIMYMTTAANLKDRSCQIFLGECYERGNFECVRDWELSTRWYSLALEASEDEEDDGMRGSSLTPQYELQARMAEMYLAGEHCLEKDAEKAAELFNEAAEGATNAMKGRRAAQLFERAEIAYGEMEE